MSGRLICVVGPSGVGKDSVMAALATRHDDVVLARRVITRAAEAGGEPFRPVTQAEFDKLAQAGHFVLHWQAHGLSYGIPATIRADLEAGRDVLVNLSRSVLPQALAAFPGAEVIALTAPAEVLAERLAARSRETAPDIARRLRRADHSIPEGVPYRSIDNSGALEHTVAQISALLFSATEVTQ